MRLIGFWAVLVFTTAPHMSDAQVAVVHYQFDIPRSPLDNALQQFAHQAGLQIARFSYAGDTDTRVGPVLGTLTSEEALRRLLADSGLTYQFLTARTIAILRQPAVHDDGPAAPSPTKAGSNPRMSERAEHLEQVIITASRSSLEESLALKRAALGVEEVMTAREISNLPKQNVADVLQHIPGMNVESGVNGNGGFDENNRISIRGTGTALTQTIINGHTVAVADWFQSANFQTAGRSLSYELLPTELLQRAVIHKSQTADLIEGGVAGLIDLQTPRPLEFKQAFTLSGSLGGVYSDLPAKTEPQFNGWLNWQNGRLGVLALGFYQKRAAGNDGQDVTGYSPIEESTAKAWRAANPTLPDVTGAQVPGSVTSQWLNQGRERAGGLFALELKPTQTLTLDLDGFYSRLDTHATERSFAIPNRKLINTPDYTPSRLNIADGVLVSGTWPMQSEVPHPVYYGQTISHITTAMYYVDLRAALQLTGKLTLDAQTGYSRGDGNPRVWTIDSQGGNGVSFSIHGISSPISVSLPGLNTASDTQFTHIATRVMVHSIDAETYGQLNALWRMDSGALHYFKIGARFSSHLRQALYPETSFSDPGSTAQPPIATSGQYPSKFGVDPGNGGYPNNIFTYSDATILDIATIAPPHDPRYRFWIGEFRVKEGTAALYAMLNIGGAAWSGNFGVRIVHTQDDNLVNVPDPTATSTSVFGAYTPALIKNHYFDVLPSLTLKLDPADDLVLRSSVARTLARPDYSALGFSGNPNVKPVRATNYDAALEWYYAPQSLLQLELFYIKMASYAGFGGADGRELGALYGPQAQRSAQYSLDGPLGTNARVQGAELSWTQPLGRGFGAQVNLTYADGRTARSTPMLGNSRITYNLEGYYQSHGFNVHLDYTFRSHYPFASGQYGPSYTESETSHGNLDAALNYMITDHLELAFNALNITNQTIKYYAANASQPTAFYRYGRQYYFTARVSF